MLTFFFSVWSTGDPFAPPPNLTANSSRGAKHPGLDFYEDPFKNSNYRYADPFDGSENGDPFFSKTSSEDDPFASVPPANATVAAADFDAAFGGDPFAGGGGGDPFSAATAAVDPFGGGGKTAGSGDPFGPPPGSSAADPFGGSGGKVRFDTSSADPFGNSFGGSVFSASQYNNNKLDSSSSFGVNNNAAFSNDPFRQEIVQ